MVSARQAATGTYLLMIIKAEFAAMVLMTLTLIMAAKSEAQNIDADHRCESNEFILQCPSRCRQRCDNEVSFYRSHKKSCDQLLVSNGVQENETCSNNSVNVSFADILKQCITTATGQPRPQIPIPEIASILEGFPTCAPSILSLQQMYLCLDNAGNGINEAYKPLEQIGYTKIEEPEKICELSKNKVSSDINLAQNLSNDSQKLVEHFKNTSECRRQIEGWLDEKSKTVNQNKHMIDNFIKQIRKDLQSSQAQEAKVRGVMDKANRDREAITVVTAFYYIGCEVR